MKTFGRLGWVLAAVAIAPGMADAGPFSAAFEGAMAQMCERYIAPNGVTLDELEKNIPSNVAILMGVTLQSQIPHVKRDPALREPFLDLQREFRGYLAGVAARAGNFDRVSGKPMDADALWAIAIDAANGRYNQLVLDEYGRAPEPGQLVLRPRSTIQGPMATGPIVTGPSRTPSSPDEGRGRLLHERQDQQLNLLGQRPIVPSAQPTGQPPPSSDASAAVIALYNSGVDAWNASLELWQSGNFAGSKQKCQEAQSTFARVRQLSPSMVGAMSCWFSDPAPNDPAPNWAQCGPFLSTSPVMRRSRAPLRRWNE